MNGKIKEKNREPAEKYAGMADLADYADSTCTDYRKCI